MQDTQRYAHNIDVLRAFKQGGYDTALLKTYSGWGGLRRAIFDPKVYHELKGILSPEEIISLKQTLSSAYYTPCEIVKFIYGYLQALDFQGGEILEPAAGNGVFLEHMPAELKAASQISAVEIDKVSAEMLKKLYGHVNVHQCGFEVFQPAQKYDLIIGNPPYGPKRLYDNCHPDLKAQRIHHYFAAKSMRLLKPNGLLAMVLPTYFMDNLGQHVRHIIQREGGELIAAYRLPEDLFLDAKVTVDVVFLRKAKTENSPCWLQALPALVNGKSLPINEYFHQYKKHILGKMAVVQIHGRDGLTCRRIFDNVFERLAEFLPASPAAEKPHPPIQQLKEEAKNMSEKVNSLSKELSRFNETLKSLCQKVNLLEKS